MWPKSIAIPDRSGKTPTHWAAESNQPKVIMALAALRATLDAVDGRLQTPLHVAVQQDDIECIRTLLASGKVSVAV